VIVYYDDMVSVLLIWTLFLQNNDRFCFTYTLYHVSVKGKCEPVIGDVVASRVDDACELIDQIGSGPSHRARSEQLRSRQSEGEEEG
jgi:hypothetical protein